MATQVNNLSAPPTPPATEQQQEVSFYDQSDAELAKINIYHLALSVILAHSNYYFATCLMAGHVTSSLFQQYHAYQAIPKSAPIYEKMLAFPVFSLLGFVNPTIAKISYAATLYGIVKNSVTKFSNCLSNAKGKEVASLSAAALHTFNAVAQGYFTKKDLASIENKHIAFKKFNESPTVFLNVYFCGDNQSFEHATKKYNSIIR